MATFASTLEQMVAAQAARLGDLPGVLAPGREALSFARLEEHIRETRLRLWELGIGRGDVVANVLANGPDSATASLSVTACASVAALNPDLLQGEYESLFEELDPRIILASPDQAEPARKAALVREVPVVDVVAEPEAGAFTLRGKGMTRRSATTGQLAQSGDIAYIITTSGSTARPKLVPLSHRVVCSTISAVGAAIKMTPADRCLSFSPQFHLLGFSSGFLVPLGNGGSTVLTQGFQVDDFFDWLEEFQPTWFPAVPAILREILEHSSRHAAVRQHSSIRFVRTGGSPLPGSVAEEIEALFGAPLLQVYGLSEAPSIVMDHFPGERRRGSCGHPTCNEVRLVASDGGPVQPGETGEVAVRGPAVIDGYFGNGELTRTAFHEGWFYTGDIGYFDTGNFLYLTGRASEFINRGGEKVSPVEVDQVLMLHPDVAEAVTFSVPHPKLGEDVAAAVVAREAGSLTAAQLQKFAAARLAAHKLPRRIFFLDKLPVGATGKVQRSKLRELVCLSAGGQSEGPRNEIERRIGELFGQVLHRERVGIHDNFFDLGGDSLAAAKCAQLLEEEFGSTLPPGVFLWAPTAALLAEMVASATCLEREPDVLPFQPRGDGVPLFLIHPGHEGARLARHLGENRPLFGIPIPASSHPDTPRSIHEMAADCTRVLRSFRPGGPYALAGWCANGVIAMEMARQIEQEGGEVCFVAMLDARNFFLPPLSAPHLAWVRSWRWARRFVYVVRRWPQGFWRRFQSGVRSFLRRFLRSFVLRFLRSKITDSAPVPLPENTRALFCHRPLPWAGRMVHIWASDWPRGRYFDPGFGWDHLSPNGFVFHQVAGDHLTMIQEPHVGEVAEILAGELDRVPVSQSGGRAFSAAAK